MPAPQVIDEVVSARTPSARGGGVSARPVESERVDMATGAVMADRSGVEDDSHGEGGRRGRVFKESTAKLLEKFEKEEQDARAPAPHEEGDADEGEEGGNEVADEGSEDAADETGDAAESAEGDTEAGEDESEGEEAGEGEPSAEWQTTAQRLEARNRELLGELETARKTPKSQRTDRETARVAAEAAYIDEGSVPALRKFLSVITGAAPDSKEVDAELAGLYTDLTARELGVALDQNQQTLRDNARTRLLLARDKREKVEAEKKPVVDDSADTVQYEQAAKYVDNMLVTKGQSGTSLADECPLLMSLAEDFDGYKPAEVLARAIRQEYMTGSLDPAGNESDALRTVAQKIERYYDGLAKKIEAARVRKTKPSTTTPSAEPKAAVEASKEQRQSQGARTLTNAAASRAPAKLPKATAKIKSKSTAEKTRKDFKTDADFREYLFDKHKM